MTADLNVTAPAPEQTPSYPHDVPPEVLAMADQTVLRFHELLDGAPLALVVSAYRAARAQAFREAAEMVENSKPESTNRDYLRAMDAYQTALAAGLRIAAKLTPTTPISVAPPAETGKPDRPAAATDPEQGDLFGGAA